MNFDTIWNTYEKELSNFVKYRLFDIMQEVVIKIFKIQEHSCIELLEIHLFIFRLNEINGCTI